MTETRTDQDLLDGCDLDFTKDPMDDTESDLYALFAEAVDETTSKTIEEAEADWKELLQ